MLPVLKLTQCQAIPPVSSAASIADRKLTASLLSTLRPQILFTSCPGTETTLPLLHEQSLTQSNNLVPLRNVWQVLAAAETSGAHAVT
jgi:hypothetical protein